MCSSLEIQDMRRYNQQRDRIANVGRHTMEQDRQKVKPVKNRRDAKDTGWFHRSAGDRLAFCASGFHLSHTSANKWKESQ